MREWRGALQIDCANGTKQLRGREPVAGLVLRAPVAARRDEVRAPKTHHACSVQNVGDVDHTWVIRGQLKTIMTCEHKIKVPKI